MKRLTVVFAAFARIQGYRPLTNPVFLASGLSAAIAVRRNMDASLLRAFERPFSTFIRSSSSTDHEGTNGVATLAKQKLDAVPLPKLRQGSTDSNTEAA